MNIIYMYIVYVVFVVYIVTSTGFIGVSVVQGHPPASAAGRPTQPQLGLYLSAGPQPRPPQRLQSADLVLHEEMVHDLLESGALVPQLVKLNCIDSTKSKS